MKEKGSIKDKNIKSYYIKDDKIIINYYNTKEKEIMLYNEDIELNLIKKLEKNLENKDKHKLVSNNNIKKSIIWISVFGMISFLNVSSLIKSINNIIVWISLSFTSLITILSCYDAIKEINNIKNIDKMSSYICIRKNILNRSKNNDKVKKNNNEINNSYVVSNNKHKTKKLILKKD